MKIKKAIVLKIIAHITLYLSSVALIIGIILVAKIYVKNGYNFNFNNVYFESDAFAREVASDISELINYMNYDNYTKGYYNKKKEEHLNAQKASLENEKANELKNISLIFEAEFKNIGSNLESYIEPLERELSLEDNYNSNELINSIEGNIEQAKENANNQKESTQKEMERQIKETNESYNLRFEELNNNYLYNFEIEMGLISEYEYERIKTTLSNQNSNIKFIIIDREYNNAITNIDLNNQSEVFDIFKANGKYNVDLLRIKENNLLEYIKNSQLNANIIINDNFINTNIIKLSSFLENIITEYKVHLKTNYEIYVTINPDLKAKDKYFIENSEYKDYSSNFGVSVFLIIAGFILSVISFIHVIVSAGHKEGSDNITINWFDKIYLEIYSLLGFVGAYTVIYLLANNFRNGINNTEILSFAVYYIAYSIMCYTLLYLLATLFLLSLVRRIKSKTLFSNSIIYKIFLLIKIILNNIKLMYRLVIVTSVMVITNFVFNLALLYLCNTDLPLAFLSAIIFNAIFFIYALKTGINFYKIYQGAEKISKGDSKYKINTSSIKYNNSIKILGENINNIGNGISLAVEESLKNERLKTDLITNVSHDLKTPLTSIINYVELIKREKIDNENIKEYINILDEKSQRLKHLTEDLMEASKASSGNISIELSEINLVELIKQTNGEFEEKFLEKRLELIFNSEEDIIVVNADGKRIYRVLENLYTNIYKYALSGTRVYIDMEHRQNKVSLSIKNISSSILNINANDLTERFIRGDISRSTEGSGLGLSIAKSLVEIQGGEFNIYIDGDLFKIVIKISSVN